MAIFRTPWANALIVGEVAPGAKLNFYEVGTTTRKEVSDIDGDALSNPVIADANGIFAAIYGTGAYKVILTDANDVVLSTIATYTFETDVEALEGSLSAPAGTVMAFFQASAPTGWTQVTTHNNKMMRVVSGTGGGSGGTDSPIAYSQDLSHVHGTSSHALTVNEMPVHKHDTGAANNFSSSLGYTSASIVRGRYDGILGPQTAAVGTDEVGGGAAHTHGNTASASLTAEWDPLYIDMIICSKDA